MAIELNRLIEKISHLDVKLVAGKNGLHNLVTWVHMVEAPGSCSFLDGGELSITTGIGLRQNGDLFDLVKRVYEADGSGIIINIGPYIEAIDDEIISFCDENNLPLFQVPWKTHLTEIIRISSVAITKEEQGAMQLASALKNAIAFPGQSELYLVTLQSHGFSSEASYCTCCIDVEGITTDREQRLSMLSNMMDISLKRTHKLYSLFVHEDRIIMVMSDYDKESVHSLVQEAIKKIHSLITSKESISYGCGKITKSIRCLHKTYHQAKSIQRLHANGKLGDGYHFYSSLGVYKLLLAVDDSDITSDYCEATIGALREYDQSKGSDLCEVLSCYLRNDCSVQKTSAELFLHRNTVNNKVAKASEILDKDLSLLHNRIEISLAFMLENL